ncbi:hypothetical protein SBOR_2694 [Sclerotinia borealis F-4128]|uniref:Uncharacterized protein n=1 Tax=Sclerotinia borealis (strain F-4128) TaxID=1432307 RepID=W9CR02_SCLBF|nr:hypothetical protein SBOR_2694 [Sclerotinia borealis F-4128]
MEIRAPSDGATPIKDLRAVYPGAIKNIAVTLIGMRPYAGSDLDSDIPADQASQKSLERIQSMKDAGRPLPQCPKVDTNGIDVALIMLRTLLAYHMDLCIPQDKITAEEVAFYKAAWMNIGWHETDDWEVKKQLFKSLLGVRVLSPKDINESKLCFEGILAHTKLQNLFKESTRFNITSHLFRERKIDEPESVWIRGTSDPLILSRFNDLEWDGTKELGPFINRHFDSVKYKGYLRLHYGAKPLFCRVLFEPKIIRSISELWSFRMAGTVTKEFEEGDTCYYHDETKHTYVLCAIIRLGNGSDVKDDIRIYAANGREIVPMPSLGRPKELVGRSEFMESGKRWSIQDGGRYMLFYARSIPPEGEPDPETFIDYDAPEFKPRRSWVPPDNSIIEASSTENASLDHSMTDVPPYVPPDDSYIEGSIDHDVITGDGAKVNLPIRGILKAPLTMLTGPRPGIFAVVTPAFLSTTPVVLTLQDFSSRGVGSSSGQNDRGQTSNSRGRGSNMNPNGERLGSQPNRWGQPNRGRQPNRGGQSNRGASLESEPKRKNTSRVKFADLPEE